MLAIMKAASGLAAEGVITSSLRASGRARSPLSMSTLAWLVISCLTLLSGCVVSPRPPASKPIDISSLAGHWIMVDEEEGLHVTAYPRGGSLAACITMVDGGMRVFLAEVRGVRVGDRSLLCLRPEWTADAGDGASAFKARQIEAPWVFMAYSHDNDILTVSHLDKRAVAALLQVDNPLGDLKLDLSAEELAELLKRDSAWSRQGSMILKRVWTEKQKPNRANAGSRGRRRAHLRP